MSACTSDLIAIRTPPPNFLNFFGLFGSEGCEAWVLPFLKIINFVSLIISWSLTLFFSQVSLSMITSGLLMLMYALSSQIFAMLRDGCLKSQYNLHGGYHTPHKFVRYCKYY